MFLYQEHELNITWVDLSHLAQTQYNRFFKIFPFIFHISCAAGEVVDNHEFLLKGQPPVTQHFCFAVDGQQRGNDVLYRFHSCCCTSCMTDLGECRHLDFVGAWNTKTVTFHPILSHPDWRDFERQIRADLLQHTATLLQPILCLGVRPGLQCPEVILVPPLASVSPRSIHWITLGLRRTTLATPKCLYLQATCCAKKCMQCASEEFHAKVTGKNTLFHSLSKILWPLACIELDKANQ